MSLIEVKVPDIGDFDAVEVIEVLVKPGDTVEQEQSLIVLESDKASMEVPSSAAGKVVEVRVKVAPTPYSRDARDGYHEGWRSRQAGN